VAGLIEQINSMGRYGRLQGLLAALDRPIFISHAWRYGDDYDRLVPLIDQGLGVGGWRNLSVEQNRPIGLGGLNLAVALNDLISRAKVVLVISGMYLLHRDAIQSEIQMAVNNHKPIISVIPWGQQRSPEAIAKISWTEVGWTSKSVCDAIRLWS
jgi:hypothetical protein